MARMAARWLALLLALAPGPGPWGRPAPGRTAFLAAARREWVGRVGLLRGFPRRDKLRYDPAGRPLRALPPGPWTLAEMRVDRIDFRGGWLRLRGVREGLLLPNFESVSWHEALAVRVRLGADPLNRATIRMLNRGIFISTAELPAAVPAYWRRFAGGPSPQHRRHARRVRGAVVNPREVYAPNPRYTRAARRFGLTGGSEIRFLVGLDGRAHQIRIVRPIGLGLDDNAVRAVRSWRFQPGRIGGVPTAMVAHTWINFHL